jgi:hypothetical protein
MRRQPITLALTGTTRRHERRGRRCDELVNRSASVWRSRGRARECWRTCCGPLNAPTAAGSKANRGLCGSAHRGVGATGESPPTAGRARPPNGSGRLNPLRKPVGAEKRGSQPLRGLHVHLLFHARARISDRSEVGKQVGPWCVGSTGIVGNGSADCGAKHQCVRSPTVEATLTRARCSVYAAIA